MFFAFSQRARAAFRACAARCCAVRRLAVSFPPRVFESTRSMVEPGSLRTGGKLD